MSTVAFLKELEADKIELWVDGDRLRYRAARGAMTPERLSKLKEKKNEIIARLRAAETQTMPLSAGQEAFWVLHRLAPASAAYHIAFAVRLVGPLQPAHLSGALARLVARHPALRTVVGERDGKPTQWLPPDLPLDFAIVDCAPAVSPEEMHRRLRVAYEEPFAFNGKTSLFRARLFIESHDSAVLLLCVHHIIHDAWSLWLLLEELRELYLAEATGLEPRLAAVPATYRAYVEAEKSYLASPVGDADLAYWRQTLAGPLPVLQFPVDKAYPKRRRYVGDSVPMRLSLAETAALRQLAKEQGVSLYLTLLCGYLLLLHRYSGQNDVLVGAPMSLRDDPRFNATVGYFVNPAVVRSIIDPATSVGEFLRDTHAQVIAAMKHKCYPLLLLVEELGVERDLSRTPLYQATFSFQQLQASRSLLDLGSSEDTVARVAWGELDLQPYAMSQQEGQFDFHLELMELGKGLTGALKYNPDLLACGTAERLAEQLLRILRTLPAQIATAVGHYPLLSETEEDLILRGWNTTERDYDLAATLADRLHAQAAATPEAQALIGEQGVLTYAELNARSNRLAHYLRQRGLGAGDFVGVFAERSFEMVIALHAVVKAGAAYVPIDPDYPVDRIAFIMEDAGCALLLTQYRLLPSLPAAAPETFCLDSDADALALLPDTAPDAVIDPEHPAYMIYTSGSTGKPKGVSNRHRAICNRLVWMQEAFPLSVADRVMQKTPFSFDVSVWEFFWPSMVGAGLVIARPGGHRDTAYLVSLIREQSVTTLHFVPPMLQAFVADPGVAACTTLRRVFCSGESLPFDLQQRFFARLDCELHNLYGPTEAAVDVTHWACEREPTRAIVPIGRPIANTRIYILDEFLRPVPIGVTGELYIGGVNVARGYHKRPELTAEKFIVYPFADGAHGLLFKSGDLARYHADGAIEYLGRADTQVKMRGLRIELGEIENVLQAVPGVREAVVALREDQPGQPYLAGYVVRAADAPPLAEMEASLRERLRAAVPDYMVPAVFVDLASVPLSPNGKLDRRALPQPDWSAATPDALAPRTPTERAIAELWQGVLGHACEDVRRSFFTVGGQSLVAIQLISRIRDRFSIEIPLPAFFENATIAGLAALVDMESGATAPMPYIGRADRDRPIPLSFAQERIWFLDQLEGPSPTYNVPVGFEIAGQLDVERLHACVAALCQRHEILRTTFAVDEGVPYQVVHDSCEAEFVHWPAMDVDPKTRRCEAEVWVMRPFDLERGPLLRVGVQEHAVDRSLLLLVMHHSIADGWSLRLLLGELATLYNQGASSPTALPLPALQYADYSVWQRASADAVAASELGYWRQALAGAPGAIALPTFRTPPATRSHDGGCERLTIDHGLAETLAALGQEQDATLFMVLAAAFSALLSRLSGQAEVTLGTPVANRNRTETESLPGLFVNTIVLRADHSGDPGFATCLERFRDTARQAFAHQALPFERLVDALQPERNLSQTPLFNVMFVLQDSEDSLLSLAGLDVTPLPMDSRTAKFDLSLYACPGATGIELVLEYTRDRFDASDARRLLENFRCLLRGVADEPDCGVSALPLMTPAARTTIVETWNDTVRPYDLGPGLNERLQQQFALTPDAVALVAGERRMTYGELDRRTRHVARRLIDAGVRPDDLIGVFMERSFEMVIALVGIVRAGAAYVPLDPDYPADRLGFMLDDSGAAIILTQPGMQSKLAYSGRWFEVIADDVVVVDVSPLPVLAVTPDHLAYMIYTSGSTGRPKGVGNSHRAIGNRLLWMQEAYRLAPSDVVLQKTPFSFDVSVWEFFWPLMTGAQLVVSEPGGHRDADYLIREIRRAGVTTLHFVPSMLQAFVEAEGVEQCRSLKRVICSGEALPAELRQRFFARIDCELHNLYGPTEAAVDVTAWPCDRAERGSVVPIGRPIANTSIYILNEQLEVAPPGVAGELHIGGVNLARGYHRRPGLTAEKFIPNPFSRQPGARMYKTGDLARFHLDGHIEYLGRLDFQVKIRGFRIELDEIASVLATCESVREAVVLAREDIPGQKRLVAYVVADDGAFNENAVTKTLRQTLPEYMLPSAFVSLPVLPLTANGKLDRRALPAPTVSREAVHVEPRTRGEATLARIWSAALGVERVGVHDRFFALGGDSILTIQVVSKARQAGLGISARDLFQHQTIAELAAVARPLAPPAVPPVGGSGIADATRYALAPAQEGMLFHSLYDDGEGMYVEQVCLTLEGPLDLVLFRAAWQCVVDRHAALRTRFVWTDGARPHQVVTDVVEIPWRILDACEDDVEYLDRRQGFVMDQAPLMRFSVIRLGLQRVRFVWTYHHLLMDGWCLPIVLREVAALYRSLSTTGVAAKLPTPRPYADYIAWLDAQDPVPREGYWTDLLRGFTEPTPLPFARTGNGVAGTQDAARRLHFTSALSRSLETLARREHVSLSGLLQALWAVLLGRYSGKSDVVFGLTIAGRPPSLAGVEDMVGLFIHTIPVRARVAPGQTIGTLAAVLTAQHYEREPFANTALRRIQEWSDVPAGTPLFDSLLVFENYPLASTLETGDGSLRVADISVSERTNYALTCVVKSGEEVELTILYDDTRFDAGAIDRLLGHWQRLAQAVTAHPDAECDALPILADAERERIVRSWNATAEPYDLEPTLGERTLAQALRTPAHPALVFGDRQLSYAEFNRRVNQLAHVLVASGVGPDQRVGVFMERSFEMVVALHGIVRAGGAYVPLDPDYPRDRLDFMIQDSAVPVILTVAQLRDQVSGFKGRIVSLDDASVFAGVSGDEPPPVAVHPENLAYMIYTSGSTGRPKGVGNTHRAIGNRLVWMQAMYGIGPQDRVLQKTPFSFDVSVWEFFWPLMTGATLVLAEPGLHQDSAALVHLVRCAAITTIHFVPSMLRAFVEEDGIDACVALKRVICSGEALPHELQQRFFQRLGCELHNLYGPTEAAVDVTQWLCQRDAGSPLVPIGRPIANTQIYILDQAMRPAPIGIAGELYIGGVNLARGYHRRPGLTAERFVPNPFAPGAGTRLYRTGDLARFDADGAIEYLGRIDFQVKIRGFRVELGEIESALVALPSVREAVVALREDQPGQQRLVAYVVADEFDTEAARAALARDLPEYMAPRAFVRLDALPLTVSGKIDRKALPAPEMAKTAEYQAPRNAVEEILCAIWSRVLSVPRVGITDNFFALGGDSIGSIQVAAQARQQGLQFGVRDVFHAETVGALAIRVKVAQSETVEQGPVVGSIPMLPIQHYFFDSVRTQRHHFNQSALLRVAPDLDAAHLNEAWQRILDHHDSLRIRAVPSESGWALVVAPPREEPDLRYVDLCAVPEASALAEVSRLAAQTQVSLDFERGPIARAVYFDLSSAREGRLLIVAHHLGIDGVSWRIVLEDLVTVYSQLQAAREVRLPAKTASIRRWAEALQMHADSPALAAESAYWRAIAASSPTPLALECSAQRSRNAEDSQRVVRRSLNATTTGALLTEVPTRFSAQVQDVLITALVEVCTEFLQRNDLLIALEGHGREDVTAGVDVSRTAGWFTSLYPVRVSLDGDRTLANLKSVKEQLRGIPGNGIGFGILRALASDPAVRAELVAMSAPDVRFNYLGQFSAIAAGSWVRGRAEEERGPEHGPGIERQAVFDINCAVYGGELVIEWAYSENLHRRETVEALAGKFVEHVVDLIVACRAGEESGATPSDFPLARVTQSLLDRLTAGGGRLNDVYGLSPMQAGMLFHARSFPESPVYLQQLWWTFIGDLDVASFKASWADLVSRQPILRSSFHWDDAAPAVQAVHPTVELSWQEVDASNDGEAAFTAFRERGLARPFEASRAPLLRLALIRQGANSHRFLCTYHHILMDGWCLPILLRELFTIYRARVTGESSRLPPVEPYRRYVAWLQAQDAGAAKTYWTRELQGFTAPTRLCIEPVTSERTHAGPMASKTRTIGRVAMNGVHEFARRERLTLNTIVQTAWAFLLHRYSDETDIVFGATVAGRPPDLPGVADMLGVFINSVPIRSRLDPDKALLVWLRESAERHLERERFVFSSLAEIQAWSEVEGGAPLFSTLFIFENYPMEALGTEGEHALVIRDLQAHEQTPYPLTLTLLPGAELRMTVAYDTQRYAAGIIERLLTQLEEVIDQLVSGRAKTVGDLALGVGDDRDWLATVSRGREIVVSDAALPKLFSEQAQRTPERVACVSGGRSLTYAELDARSSQVARYLRAVGVEPGARVAALIGRSTNLLVALLGILKSGAAYLPLDPMFPRERLAMMIEDAAPRVILTETSLDDFLPTGPTPRVHMDADAAAIEAVPATPIEWTTPSSALAYVMFTSGSTGRPKGVQITHRSMMNFLVAMRDMPGLALDDVLLAVTTVSFDISVLELYLPLLCGARVVIATTEEVVDGGRLLALLEAERVTIMQATPATWRLMLATGWKRTPGLTILCGGEALPWDLANRLCERAAAVWNMYGPTETTVWSSVKRVDAPGSFAADRSPVTLGRPIDNTQLHVLDAAMRPSPVGVAGELYIGGAGVSPGYFKQQERTRERFVDDPFASVSGMVLYRTGDRVVRLADGDLKFLGRTDFQAKLRGHRIELGEIEGALDAQDGIDHSVVLVREDAPGDQRLVAYYTASATGLVDPATVRAALRQRLPDYMVPSIFVALDAFPLTPNAKIDRAALPPPRAGGGDASPAAEAPPQGALEGEIARIWCEALGRDEVGREDNFFDLGGHSLLLMQVYNRLRLLVDIELQVVDLFRFPTITSLGQFLQPFAVSPVAEDERAHERGVGRRERMRDRARKLKGRRQS